jgi:hypothetical protein
MDEGAAALVPEPSDEAADMPERQAEARCRLGPGDAALEHQLEGVIPMELPLTHGDQLSLCGHRPSLL